MNTEKEKTFERFRTAATRSLDAIKHVELRSAEMEADKRMRNTLRADWSVADMNTIINADHRINRPF